MAHSRGFQSNQKPKDRNKEGGDITEMFLFNDAINTLGLVELPLHGRHYTWTNKQLSPLLERLDWFFYLKCLDKEISKHCGESYGHVETSYHWPCVIEINTKIPKGHIFRFDNH